MNNFTTTKKIVDINQVFPNPWNPNMESITVYNSIKETIRQKGLIGTITVRDWKGSYQIINGEHRWKILKELEWKEIPVESIGEISDDEAYFWTLKLNEGGKNDIEKLAKMYGEMSDGQLSLLGTTQEEIKNTKDLFKFDFSQYETVDPGISADTLIHILSFKFTDSEWKEVQEAILFAKLQGQNEKQWFMILLGKYLDLGRFRELQPVAIKL